jgi:hypothetical protein
MARTNLPDVAVLLTGGLTMFALAFGAGFLGV